MTNFATWYDKYPKKVARRDAEKAWNKLTPPERQQAIDMLPLHTARWRLHATLWEYLPHPASWLNGHRFADELPNNGASAHQIPQGQRLADAGVANPPLVPPSNGAVAHNGTPPRQGLPSLVLVQAAAPTPVRSANGPVAMGAIIEGLKQQLKRSST